MSDEDERLTQEPLVKRLQKYLPNRWFSAVADAGGIAAIIVTGWQFGIVAASVLTLAIGFVVVLLHWGSRVSWAVAIGLFLAVAGAGVGAYAFRGESSKNEAAKTTDAGPPVSARIQVPHDKQRIPKNDAGSFLVSGELKGGSCNWETLWPYVRLTNGAGNQQYYQQHGPCVPIAETGTFECPAIGITSAPGSRADILLFVADSSLTRTLTNNRMLGHQSISPAPDASTKNEPDRLASAQPPNAKLLAEITVEIS